jgi:hypothetical protein
MSYTYRLASEDKWLYTGLDPSSPKMMSEKGPFFSTLIHEPLPMQLLKFIGKEILKGKYGGLGFGKRESCAYNEFLDLSFDPKEASEAGPDFADYSLEDGDVAILVMPKKKIIVPCQVNASSRGLSAMAPEPINERCFLLGEDQKICSISFDPNGTDQVKIVPNVSFMSWIKPTAGIKPRFEIKCNSGVVEIDDTKRQRQYVTMAQTEDYEREVSSIERLLNTVGLSSIVGKYPLRRKLDEDHGT